MSPLMVEATPAFQILENGAVRERLRAIVGIAEAFYPQPIQDVFVSETRDDEGRQIVESIWVFTDRVAGEFKSPMTEENFDVARTDETRFLTLQTRDFNIVNRETKDTSRMTAYIYFTTDVTGQLKASRANCAELLRVVQSHFLTRFR